ncbi:LolA family protein [Sphingobacterium bambusae]|uniref:Outer membrane lipoprotein carrier protein LolA n=1 Tax=Sphingobacterium bambusae TaxID=662858 RepID=A0ABW6BD11_9SPHI|nr:outer membrane lipoprotein carrier protein LolA [Sphingobacterium bambusae]WPL50758.1 outer membrane lipoprotein carrier protein LolA [Sphingobacterium bambusae]
MKLKILYMLLFMLPFLSNAQTRKMTTGEVTAFQQSLKRSAQIKTLSADFVQYKHMSFVKQPITSSGKIYLKQPDRFSWSYTAPFQYKMVFRNNKIFIDDQGKKTSMDIGNSKQFEKISRLVSSSMRGSVYDEKEFTVSYFKKGEVNLLKLLPKLNDTKKYIKEIILVFSSSDTQVEEVTLVEPSNDYTRFVLKNRKVNAQINDSVFNL